MESEFSRRRGVAVLLLLVWMAVIFQFSTQLWSSANTRAILEFVFSAPFWPDITAALGSLNFGLRKAAHFTEYAVLAMVAYGAVVIGFQQKGPRVLQLTLVGAILFAISDEWHQLFVPGRTSTGRDVLIDIAGASVVVVAIALWQLKTRPRIDAG